MTKKIVRGATAPAKLKSSRPQGIILQKATDLGPDFLPEGKGESSIKKVIKKKAKTPLEDLPSEESENEVESSEEDSTLEEGEEVESEQEEVDVKPKQINRNNFNEFLPRDRDKKKTGLPSTSSENKSPSKRETDDINDNLNLKAKVLASQITRSKLADDKLVKKDSHAYVCDKALGVLLAYESVDQELNLLAEGSRYTEEDIQAKKNENLQRRNLPLKTAKDNILRDFIGAIVETQRAAQFYHESNPLPGMDHRSFELPLEEGQPDDNWDDVSNEVLCNLIRYVRMGFEAEQPSGTSFRKTITAAFNKIKNSTDLEHMSKVMEDLRSVMHEDEPEDFLPEITKKFELLTTDSGTLAKLWTQIKDNKAKTTATTATTVKSIFAELRKEVTSWKQKLAGFQHMWPATFAAKRPYQHEVDKAEKGETQTTKKKRVEVEKADKLTIKCFGCGGFHPGLCGLLTHPCYNKDPNVQWEQSHIGKLAIAVQGKFKPYFLDDKGNYKIAYGMGYTKDKGFFQLPKEERDAFKALLSKKHGELPPTMLSVMHDRDMELTNNDINATNTLTDREKIKRTMTLQGAHFTKCTIRVDGQEVQSEFLPDTGSISYEISGNYISGKLFDKLKEVNIKTFSDYKDYKIKLPTILSDTTTVRDHVYLQVEYKSRSESRKMRATVKAYILPDLQVDFIIGKRDLLANCWIESKHLHGYDPQAVKMVADNDQLSKLFTEAYGTYEMDEFSPEETLLRKKVETQMMHSTTVLNVLHTVGNLIKAKNEEFYEDFSLGSVEDRMKDESAEYFGDDLNDEYDDGELPQEIEGSTEFIRGVQELHAKNKEIFSRTLAKQPAKLPPFEFDIDEEKWFGKAEARGVRQQSQPKQRSIQTYIKEGLDVLVEMSTARKTSQVNMVPKPIPGEYRLTCDFRELNDCCRKMAFPLPKIEEIMGRIAKAGSSFFTKIDLTQGFHQVPLAEKHRIYTAFKTFMGTYQYLRMPMGTKGAPQYFQMCIAKVLEGLEDICQAYIDDILIHAKTEAELLVNMEKVYERLRKVGLTANPRKTSIGMQQLDYLGYTITKEGTLLVNEEGRKKLFEFPKPVFKKQLKSFIGLVNVVQSRIPDCATLTKPLNMLIGAYDKSKAGHKLEWTKEADDSFTKLKDAIANLPSLKLMKEGLRTVLRTDASDYGAGGHLVQIETVIDENYNEREIEHTIMFVSKGFDKTQLNWSTPEKECFAVWYGCTKLCYLLEGIEFEVEVDHKNLTILRDSENAKVRRWKNYLQRFDITCWRYIAGPTNEVADALSRVVEIREDDLELIKEQETIRHLMVLIERDPENIGENTQSRANLGRGTRSAIWTSPSSESVMESDVRVDTVLLPLEEENFDKAIMAKLITVLAKVHNATEGHLGVNKTMTIVQAYLKECPESVDKHYIPYTILSKAVKDFVNKCAICQKQADGLEKLYIEPFVGSTYEPMELIQIDHIGPLPEDAYGNKHI